MTEYNKEEVIKDIQLLGNVVQQHDQSIFQMIASLNAMQTILIESEICKEEDLINKTQEEAKKLQEKIMDMVNKEKEKEKEEKPIVEEEKKAA